MSSIKQRDKRQIDLTQGSVAWGLVRFSIPVIVGGLLQALYGIVDMSIAGQYIGDNALSGITNGGMIMTLLTFLAMGLSFGSNTLIAQYYGADRTKERIRVSETTVILNLAFGLLLALALCALAGPIMRLLDPPAFTEAVTYFRICALGLVFVFGYNGLTSIIKALGNSRVPLLFILMAAATNVLLDLLLVVVFHMGVEGTAIATVCAQAVSCLGALVYILVNHDLYGVKLRSIAFSPADGRDIVKIGFPSALQFVLNGLSFLVLNKLMNQYAAVEISAAYGVSTKLKDLGTLFLSSTQGTCSAMVAQCLGSGLVERAKKVVYSTFAFDLAIAALLLLAFEPWAPLLCAIFSDEPQTIQLAAVMLRIELLGMLGFCFFTPVHGLATGSGHATFVLLNGFLFICLGQIVSGFLLNHFLGYHGVNISFIIGHIAPIPHCLYFLHTQKWAKTRVGVLSQYA